MVSTETITPFSGPGTHYWQKLSIYSPWTNKSIILWLHDGGFSRDFS